MKRYIFAVGMVAAFALPSCVKSPLVTEEKFINSPFAAKTWAQGVRRQLAQTMNSLVVNAELISDNYYNNYTSNSKVFDIPQIDYFDVDVNGTQAAIHRLRQMAYFGLNTVVPADTSATASDKATMIFSQAFSYLLAGEMFVALPDSVEGKVLMAEEQLRKALPLWDQAIAMETTDSARLAYTLFKARTYYRLGDATNASTLATQLLNSKKLLFQVAFDGQSGVGNAMQSAIALVSPSNFAPLPRLDFLDPKYFNVLAANVDQKPIPLAKAEEAYLILAEAQLAAGDLSTARETLKTMLADVVSQRGTYTIDDKTETRNGGNRNDYPLTAVKVKFDASDAPREGYVLDRKAARVTVYGVSGTKVTAADLDAATTADALLYTLYRLRQEIFISEGRRMADLGIKFPVSQIEQLNNPNVLPEHTQAQLPSFIPLNRGMDDFTTDPVDGTVTMKFDMNKVLVQNKTAKEIFPFIN
ncbi:MAG: hypothetical protein P0Y53_04635 [Candidatus Pseudobacter hemicellulosilyticus]|uniref:Tetratricopeptide repeat protein n=1 Tax=Candidatus Pseudobacter hemicellulosilyticus TaxID=3121375 RepID=A0AAJ5WYR1_9BACT|nr:MAG: hypothetical protein P0Y53_04635 [Pseudobacter sp.]